MYFDYAAGQPLLPEVKTYLEQTMMMSDDITNPHSIYSSGRRAAQLIRNAEEAITELDQDNLGLSTPRYIWAGSGSQANIIALKSYLTYSDDVLLYNQTSHKSIAQTAFTSESYCVFPGKDELIRFPKGGFVYPPTIISITTVHPETGVIFSKAKFSELLDFLHRTPKIKTIHFDMIQGQGDISREEIKTLEELNYEILITRSSHKIGGPAGLGVIIANNLSDRLLYTGTPNPFLIDAYRYAYSSYCGYALELKLRSKIRDFIRNNGLEDQFKIAEFEGVNYVENIVPIECVGQDGLMLAIEADSHGIQFSTGSACNKDGVSPTYRLLHGDKAKSIIRLSGPTKVATQEELYHIDDMISYLFETLQNIIKEQ